MATNGLRVILDITPATANALCRRGLIEVGEETSPLAVCYSLLEAAASASA